MVNRVVPQSMGFIVAVVPGKGLELMLADAPAHHPQDPQERHEAQADAGEKSDAVDPEHRDFGDRSVVRRVDLCLLPRSPEEHGAAPDDEQVGENHAHLAARIAETGNKGLDAQMRILAADHDGADEGQPDEEEARQLFGDVDSGVEQIAQHDIAEDHDDHGRQEKDHKPLQPPEEEGYYPAHRRSLLWAPSWTLSKFCSSSRTLQVLGSTKLLRDLRLSIRRVSIERRGQVGCERPSQRSPTSFMTGAFPLLSVTNCGAVSDPRQENRRQSV